MTLKTMASTVVDPIATASSLQTVLSNPTLSTQPLDTPQETFADHLQQAKNEGQNHVEDRLKNSPELILSTAPSAKFARKIDSQLAAKPESKHSAAGPESAASSDGKDMQNLKAAITTGIGILPKQDVTNAPEAVSMATAPVATATTSVDDLARETPVPESTLPQLSPSAVGASSNDTSQNLVQGESSSCDEVRIAPALNLEVQPEAMQAATGVLDPKQESVPSLSRPAKTARTLEKPQQSGSGHETHPVAKARHPVTSLVADSTAQQTEIPGMSPDEMQVPQPSVPPNLATAATGTSASGISATGDAGSHAPGLKPRTSPSVPSLPAAAEATGLSSSERGPHLATAVGLPPSKDEEAAGSRAVEGSSLEPLQSLAGVHETLVHGAQPDGSAVAARVDSSVGSRTTVPANAVTGDTIQGNSEATSSIDRYGQTLHSFNVNEQAFSRDTEAVPSLGTVTSTANVLEVGLPHGTHGWLKVRAEIADGTVAASVSATTVEGRERLHRDLPALTAYLQEEKVEVGSLVVRETASTANPGFGDGGGTHGRHGAPRQQEQALGKGFSRDDSPSPESGSYEEGRSWSMPRSWTSNGSYFVPASAGSSGGWLNVRV